MALSISAVVLLLVVTIILMRTGRLRLSHAVICALLGFCMADTSIAPTIQDGVRATASVVSAIRP